MSIIVTHTGNSRTRGIPDIIKQYKPNYSCLRASIQQIDLVINCDFHFFGLIDDDYKSQIKNYKQNNESKIIFVGISDEKLNPEEIKTLKDFGVDYVIQNTQQEILSVLSLAPRRLIVN